MVARARHLRASNAWCISVQRRRRGCTISERVREQKREYHKGEYHKRMYHKRESERAEAREREVMTPLGRDAVTELGRHFPIHV